MKTVDDVEVKTHLSQLLDSVEKGESITILRHGKPVATLRPVDEPGRMPVAEAVAEMKKLRKSARLDGLSIREPIEEGRE